MTNKERDSFIKSIKKNIELIFMDLEEENEQLAFLEGEAETKLYTELIPILWEGFAKECEAVFKKIPEDGVIQKYEPPIYELELINPFNRYVENCISFLVLDIARVVEYLFNNGYSNNRQFILEHLGLSPYMWKEVERFRGHLENLNRYALTYKLNNPYYTQEIVDAIQEGRKLSEAEIDRILSVYTKKKRAERFETLAGTLGLTILAIADYETVLYGFRNGNISGYLRRFWVHMDDERVRLAHIEIPPMNPEGIAIDGVYQTPLGPLRYPRDPQGSLDNVLRCRCEERYKMIGKK